ncbi:glycoside hydrolase family 13 protein [Aaosphaeria arxii CBS 175.79]|uniref:alpha-amylase n=1 Tax=Aaosphaeria arxii CBS 175.79 TaxID=1450172 RepID=A0A6A5Y4X0_9PLEO|nr:glycoside hydrolase family 13 protein [Aaosphaeria arxii CBS 175.79]KAF2020306.1 glycoside hydrolase family 13 protein [Aaosphaeria arxii CBS 175.79]
MTAWLAQAVVIWAFVSITHAATPEQWRSRSIYQLLTDRYARADRSTTAACNVADGNYCGGSWRGIIEQLDYIQNMGFTAIWISPVTYNLPERTKFGYAYHGYWQQDLYRLNSNFGTADDLKALSVALHDRDMANIVVNHNGWNGTAESVDYSRFHPFDQKEHFHDYCTISNYSDQAMVEGCWLGDVDVELPDLNTEHPFVLNEYRSWIKQLVSNYSIDGIRLDTAKHVGRDFWSSFQEAAGIFSTGEVLSGNPVYVCEYQNTMHSILNYPLYYPMMLFLNSTKGTSTPLVKAIDILRSACKDVTLLTTFSENHDLPRFASQTQDLSLAKNVIALTILWDGIPIIYAGQEQHYAGYGDPGNREATWLAKYSREGDLYNIVAALNQARNRALSVDPAYLAYNIHAIYNSSEVIALRKGHAPNQIVSIYTSAGMGTGSSILHIGETGWPVDTEVVELITCQSAIVSSDGKLPVAMKDGLPRVYMSSNAIGGSGICGMNGTNNNASGTTVNNGFETMPNESKSSPAAGHAKSIERIFLLVVAAAVAAVSTIW